MCTDINPLPTSDNHHLGYRELQILRSSSVTINSKGSRISALLCNLLQLTCIIHYSIMHCYCMYFTRLYYIQHTHTHTHAHTRAHTHTHTHTHSAILYLNGNFDGGKFFFAHSPKDLSPEVCHSPQLCLNLEVRFRIFLEVVNSFNLELPWIIKWEVSLSLITHTIPSSLPHLSPTYMGVC